MSETLGTDQILKGDLDAQARQDYYESLQNKDEPLYFNGIDGTTGSYDVPPMTGEALAAIIQGESPPENLGELDQKRDAAYPIKPPNDPARLDEAGWAVVFPAAADAVVKEALWELLELRREQAGDRFKIYEGNDGYRPGETKAEFLDRHGVGRGPADPEQMPYYVLLVGSPEQIPYEFQYQLDVMRAVGRIHFDSVQDYANYAHNVVRAEKGEVKLGRQATFFGVANPDDRATALSARYLVDELYRRLDKKQPFSKRTSTDQETREYSFDWQLERFLAGQATKAQLTHLLGGGQTPALLFTASHGMAFHQDDRRQLPHQGALLCQDWPGPKEWQKPIKQDFYFAGDDLTAEANLLGLITFHFACFSAGTPRLDQFAMHQLKDRRAAIAPHSFLGALPTGLLRHGALASIGHVERAWGYSFLSPRAGKQVGTFETALHRLLIHDPVGLVVEDLNMRYAELATELADVFEEMRWEPGSVNPYELAALWTTNNDARAYIVVGDPAARLPIALPDEAPAERPAIEVAPVPAEQKASKEEATYASEPAGGATAESAQASRLTLNLAGPQALNVSGTILLQPAGAEAEYPVPEVGPYAKGLRWPWAGAEEDEDEEEAKEEKKKLSEAIQGFIQNAARAVGEAAKEAATLQIVTYTMDDLDQDELKELLEKKTSDEAEEPQSLEALARPRAITRIGALGDIQVFVPREGGEIDKELWALHAGMVQQAQDNRTALLKVVVEALSGQLPG